MSTPKEGQTKRHSRTPLEVFEENPYPHISLSADLFSHAAGYYRSSIITPVYKMSGRLPRGSSAILDVGCGTGFKTLQIAVANPDASVLGIDFSAPSIAVAQQRQQEKRVNNVEFRVLHIEELTSLGRRFDFVNCDDVLYLVDDVAGALADLAASLEEDGVLRANVHNENSRRHYLRAQRALALLGILQLPARAAIAATRAFYGALPDNARFKQRTWSRRGQTKADFLLANHLLIGDKGFTLDDTFALIDGAGLELIDFVDGFQWSLDAAFRPAIVRQADIRERAESLDRRDALRFVDLVHYERRLYDFWCCRKDGRTPFEPFEKWNEEARDRSTVLLHPALLMAGALDRAAEQARQGCPLDLAHFVPNLGAPTWIADLPLHLLVVIGRTSWKLEKLVDEWLIVRPVDPLTRRPRRRELARADVLTAVELLSRLGAILCLRA